MLFLILIVGCSTPKDFPVYDQVLTYDRPYDYTFLKVLEALNTFPEWTLEETDKVKGIIIVRNTQFGHLFDRDKWAVRFNVKSLARKQTSISIDPGSQHNAKGGELLKRIDEIMMMSKNLRGEVSAQAIS